MSTWLFAAKGEEYSVNAEGKRVINLLVQGKIPVVELALRSIAHLTRSRLEASQGFSFVKPVFDELLHRAREGTLMDQNRLLTLIEVLGASDPENALDTIKAIRENKKDTVEVTDPLWGKIAFTHKSVTAKLPWLLFQIAAFVTDVAVALRFLKEFRQLLIMEELLSERNAETGQQPSKLLVRLLRESKNAVLFAEPAGKIIFQEIGESANWPFLGVLLECLLNPEREYTEWTAQWTLTLTRRVFVPFSPEWNLAAQLRDLVFDQLRHHVDSAQRARIWKLLANSHHQFHRLLLNDRIGGAAADAYRALLVSDLTACALILEKPPVELTIEEHVAARSIWSWYLEYGKSC